MPFKWLSLCVWCFAVGAGAQDLFPLVAALPTTTAPVLDGVLDEPCWQTAETTAPLTAIGGAAVPVATVGQLCHDRDMLYLAVHCAEPAMAVLQARLDAKQVGLMEESLEIFLNPGHDHHVYFQFRVDVLGQRDTHVGNDIDLTLDRQWRAAVKIGAEAWTIEAAIPFALYGGSPGPASLWGLNLNRQRLVAPGQMWTCWSDTKGPFHSPARFGHLVFAAYPAWLTAYFEQRFTATDQELAELRQRFPFAIPVLAAQLASSPAPRQAYLASLKELKLATGLACQPHLKAGETLVAAGDATLAEVRLEILRHNFGKKP